MVLAIVVIEIGVRNAVAVVAAALLPIAVLGVPVAGAMLPPVAPLFALLRNFLLARAM